MTIDRMDLMALIEKGADADFLREMIEVISNRLMQMEVEGLTGSASRQVGSEEPPPLRTSLHRA
jgi:hypothetical protein